MSTKRLNLLDTAWLSAEKNVAPMQVGGLLTFALYHCRYVAMSTCGHLCLRRLVARGALIRLAYSSVSVKSRLCVGAIRRCMSLRGHQRRLDRWIQR
jgi:hypothetical protein